MVRNTSNALIVFQKNTILGKVKTRLAATVGDPMALEIYAYLVKKTFEQINQLIETDVFVYFSDFIEEHAIEKSTEKFQYFVQTGNDLGERMKNAFGDVFMHKYQKVAIIGTDCPGITGEIIEEAFLILDNPDVVFGPARDGGYYLLGMNKLIDDLFEGVPWSSPEVLQVSTQKLIENNISFQFLPQLSDIDTEEDWLNYKI